MSREGYPIRDTFEPFLRDKGKGENGESGNYRRNLEGELEKFATWASGENPKEREIADYWDGVYPDPEDSEREPSLEDIEQQYQDGGRNVFREYARHLSRQGYSKGTVRNYYSRVSSWCGWCVKEGRLPISQHYAQEASATELLPDNDGRRSGDQQSWTPAHRDQLARHVNNRVNEALEAFSETDPDGNRQKEREQARFNAIKACRDRALAYIIAYTGVRSGEIVRDPGDSRRKGITWEDISLEDGSMTVLRKSQQQDEASLPTPVIKPISHLKRVLNPPSEEWPVFLTLDRPTFSELVRDRLQEKDYTQETIEEIREVHIHDLFIALKHDLIPPAMSTRSTRLLLKELSKESEITDDQEEFLKPHGGRRGMGETLVREEGFTQAARYLDNSEQMIRESYSHIEAAEQADIATEALARTDSFVRVRNGDETEI